MHRLAIFAATAVLGIAAAGTAQATVVHYSNFNSTNGLKLIGSAASTGSPGVLRLTPATGGQSGAAYSKTPITLGANATFSTQFQFQFTDAGGWDPADGITFLLAADPTGLGAGGVGIGYSGVPNSFAVEFDTYNNGDPDQNSSNHVAIDTNGNLTNSALANVYGNPSCGFPTGGNPDQNDHTAAGCMSNGHVWTVLITYDGSDQLLNVSLTDPAESGAFAAIENYNIDIASLLGTNTAYVGFSSGTGSGWENHDILNWLFSNTAELPPVVGVAVPEPNGLALFGLGLLGLLAMGAARRVRKDRA